MNAMTHRDNGAAIRHITAWLSGLSELTRPGREPPTARTHALYATMLAEWLPIGAFTPQSMAATVRGHAYFPSVDEIRERVADWWRDQSPASSALALSDETDNPAGWDDMDDRWVAYYWRRHAEDFGPPNGVGLPGSRERSLGLIRSQAPRAYFKLTGTWDHPLDASRTR